MEKKLEENRSSKSIEQIEASMPSKRNPSYDRDFPTPSFKQARKDFNSRPFNSRPMHPSEAHERARSRAIKRNDNSDGNPNSRHIFQDTIKFYDYGIFSISEDADLADYLETLGNFKPGERKAFQIRDGNKTLTHAIIRRSDDHCLVIPFARNSSSIEASRLNMQHQVSSTPMAQFPNKESLPIMFFLPDQNVQFMYDDGAEAHFMDEETYDQFGLPHAEVADALAYLVPSSVVQMLAVDGKPAGLQLPASVELEVSETEPAVRGDTVSNVTKPATLETGGVVQVPLFVDRGERIKVDPREGRYISRA